MVPPIAIGSKKDKLFLKFFNNPKQASINLSYIPVITQMTPLLTPGSMAPAPINIPIKKIFEFFQSNHQYMIMFKNKIYEYIWIKLNSSKVMHFLN